MPKLKLSKPETKVVEVTSTVERLIDEARWVRLEIQLNLNKPDANIVVIEMVKGHTDGKVFVQDVKVQPICLQGDAANAICDKIDRDILIAAAAAEPKLAGNVE